jgi:hypothetical protein
VHWDGTSIQDACETNQRENRLFHAVSAGIEVLASAPTLEQRRERGKQFVTGRVFGGVSRCVDEIDDSGDLAILPLSFDTTAPKPDLLLPSGEEPSRESLPAARRCFSDSLNP